MNIVRKLKDSLSTSSLQVCCDPESSLYWMSEFIALRTGGFVHCRDPIERVIALADQSLQPYHLPRQEQCRIALGKQAHYMAASIRVAPNAAWRCPESSYSQ